VGHGTGQDAAGRVTAPVLPPGSLAHETQHTVKLSRNSNLEFIFASCVAPESNSTHRGFKDQRGPEGPHLQRAGYCGHAAQHTDTPVNKNKCVHPPHTTTRAPEHALLDPSISLPVCCFPQHPSCLWNSSKKQTHLHTPLRVCFVCLFFFVISNTECFGVSGLLKRRAHHCERCAHNCGYTAGFLRTTQRGTSPDVAHAVYGYRCSPLVCLP